MRHSLEQWLEWHHMDSLAEARGRLSHRTTQNPAAYERANYIRTLQTWGAPLDDARGKPVDGAQGKPAA
jgi:dihydroorotate dehydrogenase (fumarate)